MLNLLNRQPKTLYLIRGLPGRGKSTLAKRITRHNVAADDFPNLYDRYGNYDATLQKASHQWCFEQTERWMRQGKRSIAVHNTFVQMRYFQNYIHLASKHGYATQVIHCEGVVLSDGSTTKSIHGVPNDVLERMGATWERFA